MIRLCAVAAIGLAVAACGNHDEKKADDTQPATVVPVPVETPKESTEEKEEHKTKTEDHTPTPQHHDHTTPAHHKDTTLVVNKGLPVIKDTAVLVKKPEGGGTMGSSTGTTPGTVKHHPKPGGIQGNAPKSN